MPGHAVYFTTTWRSDMPENACWEADGECECGIKPLPILGPDREYILKMFQDTMKMMHDDAR